MLNSHNNKPSHENVSRNDRNNFNSGDKINLITPIPEEGKQLLRKDTANFSLCFPRLVTWENYKGTIKPNKEIIETLCNMANTHILASYGMGLLKNIHERQTSVLDSMQKRGQYTFEISAKLISPFITGLGSGHPTETGMSLDRNTGLPFISASSIKGVLRLAHAINIADGRKEVPEVELIKYFGGYADQKKKDARRGQLIILDAFPTTRPTLKQDIMNPHFAKYYQGENSKQPIETESPVPIKFLTVSEGCEFVFRCYFCPIGTDKNEDNTFTEEDKIAVEKMFETAFTMLGFGGKTAIGYGRFRNTAPSVIIAEKV